MKLDGAAVSSTFQFLAYLICYAADLNDRSKKLSPCSHNARFEHWTAECLVDVLKWIHHRLDPRLIYLSKE